jgi:hypothetical protein
MKRTNRSFLFALGVLAASSSLAWQNHALPTAMALANMREVSDAPKVAAETLDDFLASEQTKLVKVLQDEENWARANVPHYPPRPAALAFRASDAPTQTLRQQFLRAIRVNLKVAFPLYVQELPGHPKTGASYLALSTVTLVPDSLTATARYFAELKPRQMVAPIDVVASASDEPDYGLDLHLFEDSKSTFGREYHFGNQPFGNPKLEFATQAPFHMGFYHEPSIVYWAAGYLSRTLPEYRIHLFHTLSRFAFESGHPYWGWRFAGLGVHYIQDLTQPYHSTVLPGGNTVKMLLYGLLDVIGIHGPKNELTEQASKGHLAIEEHMHCTLLQAYKNGDSNAVTLALRQTTDNPRLGYTHSYVRQTLTSQSNGFADQIADAYVSEPVKTDNCSNVKLSKKHAPLFAGLMRSFGSHTRGWVRSILPTSLYTVKGTVHKMQPRAGV